MKAYSQDVRERVLRAVDQGIPRSEIVRVLGVSVATIGRYLKQRRETGHVQPKANYVADFEQLPDWQKETDAAIFEAVEQAVMGEVIVA